MRIWKCALWAILAAATNSPAAISQQPTVDRAAIKADILEMCNTIKDVRGQTSERQLKADVQARVGGILGRALNVGGGGQGSISEEEFQGLSQEATAIALQNDRACRERLYAKLLDKLLEQANAPGEKQTTPMGRHQSPQFPQQSRAKLCCVYSLGWCEQWYPQPGTRLSPKYLLTHADLGATCYCVDRPGIVQDCP